MDRSVMCITSIVSLFVQIGVSHGRYASTPIDEIPSKRLITNLEKALEADPGDLTSRLNLARAQAQAFASGSDVVTVKPGSTEPVNPGMANYGIPAEVKITEGGGNHSEAKAHLEQAIKTYRELLNVQPDHELGRLGLGWCFLKAGKRSEAAEVLRKLEAETWERDQETSNDGPPIVLAAEVASYLIEALDPERDAAEMSAVKKHLEHLNKLQTWMSPILIPLSGSARLDTLLAPGAKARFDVDGTARSGTWSWISPEAAWLVWLPRDRNGLVSGHQLIGQATFRLFWCDGYEALASLDDDRDGVLRGSELQGLGLWRDANSDARSDPAELTTVEQAGILQLDCRARPADRIDVLGWTPRGVTFISGERRPTWDVLLRFTPDALRAASGPR